MTLDEAFYTYLEALKLQSDAQINLLTDLPPAYANVDNGLGLFGGYHTVTLYYTRD